MFKMRLNAISRECCMHAHKSNEASKSIKMESTCGSVSGRFLKGGEAL